MKKMKVTLNFPYHNERGFQVIIPMEKIRMENIWIEIRKVSKSGRRKHKHCSIQSLSFQIVGLPHSAASIQLVIVWVFCIIAGFVH